MGPQALIKVSGSFAGRYVVPAQRFRYSITRAPNQAVNPTANGSRNTPFAAGYRQR